MYMSLCLLQHYFLRYQEWSQGKERLILWCQTEMGHTLGSHTYTHTHLQPSKQREWLITPPPLPSAHRWDVRLKVDGEQRDVWCYTPSYRLEFGLQTVPPPPLPCCFTRFVSFRYPSTAADDICHCRSRLKTPLKNGLGESFTLVLNDLWNAAECLLGFAFTVFCLRNIQVSKVVKARYTGLFFISLSALSLVEAGHTSQRKNKTWWDKDSKALRL